jgi:hypothetical protein
MNNLRKIDILGTVAYVASAPFTQERFCFSYAQMVGYNTSHIDTQDRKIYYDRQQISWLPRGRNDIVKSMRGEWVFMLDADLEFDPDVLERMLHIMEKYDTPVLTGLYVHKKYPHFPVLYSHNDQRGVYEIIAKWDEGAEFFQVDAAGAGCLLIKKFVFDLIWEKLNQDPFDVMNKNGEDMSFFNRLREIGVGVYCAPQVRFSHLAINPLEYDDRRFPLKMLTDSYQRDGAK